MAITVGHGHGPRVAGQWIAGKAALRYRPAVANQPQVDGVAPEIRGILLALQATGAGDSALHVLAERLREPARLAWRALLALDEATRSRSLATWRAQATSGLPTGFPCLHPSWAAEAVADEPPAIVAAVRGDAADGRAEPPETARELARLAFSHLAPLCESEAGPLATRLLALEPDDLVVELRRRGARTVGRSLAGAPPALRARAMAGVGEPWAAEMAAGSREPATREERAAARALATAGATSDGPTADDRLLAVGIAATKAELEGEGAGSLLRLAGRLPAALGRALVGW